MHGQPIIKIRAEVLGVKYQRPYGRNPFIYFKRPPEDEQGNARNM
jgi:hypothetical protein